MTVPGNPLAVGVHSMRASVIVPPPVPVMVPFSVAPVEVMLVAALVVTVGRVTAAACTYWEAV